MELSHYLEILSRPARRRIFAKEKIDDKIDALSKILELGTPGTIVHLLPYLKYRNSAVQLAVCETIGGLFKKMSAKSTCYNTLKYCKISVDDLEVFGQLLSGTHLNQLLAISSLNYNGYVRQRAIQLLGASEDPLAVRFLLYRVSDWVREVREEALQQLEKMKTPEFIPAFTANLDLMDWMKDVQRIDLKKVHKDIMDFLVVANKTQLMHDFSAYDDKARFILAGYIAASEQALFSDIKVFLQDTNFLVRSAALRHFRSLSVRDLLPLMKDKSAQIRLQVLYRLKGEDNFRELVRPYVSDSSSRIREFVRFSLKEEKLDYAGIYHHHLLTRQHIVGALAGLAEVDGRQYSSSVEQYLSSDQLRIRKAAFLAMRKLDTSHAYLFAFAHMDSPAVGIRNVVTAFLSKHGDETALEKAFSLLSSGNVDIRKSMLKMFADTGGWEAILGILKCMADEDEAVRLLSRSYLHIWILRSHRLYVTPKPGQFLQAQQLLMQVLETDQIRMYGQQKYLSPLEFILR